MLPRQYIEIDGLKIAYSDIGTGEPVLMLHAFAASSFTWERMLKFLPQDKRYIMPDMKGFGYSDKTPDGRFSPFHQAEVITHLADKLKLKKLTLVGHSFGGAICLIALLNTKWRKNVKKLILIDSAGYPNPLPPFIKQLRIPLASNLVFNYINSEILIRVILEEMYYDKEKIDDEYVREYASILRLPGAIDCLIKGAEQITAGRENKLSERLKTIDVPALVIWGDSDKILPPANADRFKEDLREAQVAVIPECGHTPQEEKPDVTGGLISDFLQGKKVNLAEKILPTGKEKKKLQTLQKTTAPKDTTEKRPHLSRMIDKWSLTIFLMYVFVKILQVLKALGLKTKESGWRKTMGAYLRTEHSKFGLAVFGLDFLSDVGRIKKLPYNDAKEHVIRRMAAFLRDAPSSQWKLNWGKFRVFRERQMFIDLIEVGFDNEGRMTTLIPHFDEEKPPFFEIDDALTREICGTVMGKYNEVKDVRDEARPLKLRKILRRWATEHDGFSDIARQEVLSFIDRILSGHSIIFDVLDKSVSGASLARFTPPDFILHKHAGYGLLNIFCRFNHSINEADFWFQFQHVPVDGVPMQEFLLKLKKNWGIRRNLVYPPLKITKPMEPQRCSTLKDKRALYQTITFVDFRPLLKLRKKVNAHFSSEMGGPATVVSMIMWGLTQHPSLKDRKFIFPVELAECPVTKQERAPCAMFIRPSEFVNPKNPLRGFLDFQFEFNRRMNATRARKSESYEFIELYALTFPWLYTLTRKIMPRALAEFVGTVGITIIKDADLFITPLSDVQSDGFFAVGNLLVDTADKQKAGCISIRAPKEKIPTYLEACRQIQDQLDTLFSDFQKP